MAVTVGSAAPDLTLPDQDRQPVTLSEVWGRGPVVLAFFPAAFSGTCTSEMCTLRDGMAELARVGGQVVGVSVDSFFALKAWADSEHIAFPLLSDFNKTAIVDYDVVCDDMIGLRRLAKRSIFVIDRGGIVRYAEVLDDARNEPDYGRVRQIVSQLA